MSDNVYSTDGFMTTIVSPLTDQRKKIFSMDCEMVSSHKYSYLCAVDSMTFKLVSNNLKTNVFCFVLSAN